MTRRILLTGGSGFIGTNLVEYLAAQPDTDLVNLDIARPRNPLHGWAWKPVDVSDPDAVDSAVAAHEPDAIVHLAARTDLAGESVSDYRANTEGVRNVVRAAVRHEVPRALFVSSQLVCKPGSLPSSDLDFCPPNPYGESKVEGERIVRAEADDRLIWSIVRPTTIWGPWWGTLYSAFFRAVRSGRYLHPRGRTVHKSFGYVGNAVWQLDRLASVPADDVAGRVFYLADWEAYDVQEWAAEIADAFGRRRPRTVPVGILRAAALCGDALRFVGFEDPPLTSYRLSNLLTSTRFDLEPLRELCGPLPFTRLQGTAATAKWMCEQ